MLGVVGGFFCFEFICFMQIIGDLKYYDVMECLKWFFYKNQNEIQILGFWLYIMNYQREKMDKVMYMFGVGFDLMYEYLLKMYVFLGGLDLEYEKMIVKVLEVVRDNFLF